MTISEYLSVRLHKPALIAVLVIIAMTLLLAVAYPEQFNMLFTGNYSVNMTMSAGMAQ